MPFLPKIVDMINRALQDGVLSDKRFSSGDFNGIAINISREKDAGGGRETMPCIYKSAADAKYVGIDDTFPIMNYHKVVRNVVAPLAQDRQFGDGNKYIQNLVQMAMIVYADRNRIEITPDDLESLINSGMLDEIQPPQFPDKGIATLLIKPVDTNFNSAAIFSQEYQNVDYFLKPESILFQITYTVVMQYRKDCLAICGC